MLLSSPQQKQVLKKFLGWKKIKLVIPSLRFSKKKQKEFNNYIFTLQPQNK